MSPSDHFRPKLLAIAQKLPATACVLTKLQGLLADAGTGLEAVCDLLKQDPALAARVLRISNSAYYASGSPNASLEEAVTCIGFNEIYKAVSLSVGTQLLYRRLSYYGLAGDRVWLNSLATAIAAESLAQFAGVNPRAAYTQGLLRSIGKGVLDQFAAETSTLAQAFPLSGRPGYGEWERGLWGLDNPGVTAMAFQCWHFAEEAAAAMEQHYAPDPESAAFKPALLLNLACGVAEKLGHGLAGESPYWAAPRGGLDALGLAPSDLELCAAETTTGLEAVQQAFASTPELAA